MDAPAPRTTGVRATDIAVEVAIYTKRALRVNVTTDRELAVEQRVSAACAWFVVLERRERRLTACS
jgi:hypothetical protein